MDSHGLIGIAFFFIFAWAISENRRKINFRATVIGLFLQVILAILIVKSPVARAPFELLGSTVKALKDATTSGTSFVFGYIGRGTPPFAANNPAGLFVFAFQALPMVMVVGALSMLLFYWRILPFIVKGFAWALSRTLQIGGALGVAAAAKVFLGQTEAPLLIRPYLKDFSRSELFTVMTCGMATTSGTVMALYSTILENTIANPIAHIITASIISIPAAITISRVIVPQTSQFTEGNLVMPYRFSGWMDAIFRGTTDGLQMFLNIAAMLIVVIALVALTNKILGAFPNVAGEPISLERIFGVILSPITWMMGVPWSEASVAAYLLGTKTVTNEVIAFLGLAKLPAGQLSAKSNLIMTYALCGFANFSSIGIMVGGLGSLVPERRDEVISLGFKCVISGTISTCLSGTIIGLLH
ncbi:MAG: nucleoside:proton symporter [Alphaproteobacteria bacterium]|nr:nucleoside:proton symporter [Alphaproteobacteria bacterium]